MADWVATIFVVGFVIVYGVVSVAIVASLVVPRLRRFFSTKSAAPSEKQPSTEGSHARPAPQA